MYDKKKYERKRDGVVAPRKYVHTDTLIFYYGKSPES